MVKRMDVGKSWRTYAKHEFMRSICGQEIGVANMFDSIDRLVFFDLTAGDGVPVAGGDWDKTCSPGILARHAVESKKPVLILLHEIQPNTYDRLLDSLADEDRLARLGYERDGEDCWRIGNRIVLRTVNGSGQRAAVDFIDDRAAVLAFNDPNAITDWAMRPSFAQEIQDQGAWCCRMLSTMGCNTAGLKRLDLEERLNWFGLVDAQEAACPRYRDLLLSAIEGDEAQWAYLLSTSVKWRGRAESVVKTAFRAVGRTAAMDWWRLHPERFTATKLRLFLTRKELESIRGEEESWLALDTEKRLMVLKERGEVR